MEIVEFLATVPLLSGIGREELERFAEVTRERDYPKGSVIVFEDDPGDSLFIVRDGRVKVVLVGEDGREVILSVLGVGEHFGELSLIDGQPRSAHVIAMDDAKLLILRRDDFRRRVAESPAVAWAMLVELSRRLRRADEQIVSLVLLDVHAALRACCSTPPTKVVRRRSRSRSPHQTIAQMIGASRETCLGRCASSGPCLISVERRQITIADRGSSSRCPCEGVATRNEDRGVRIQLDTIPSIEFLTPLSSFPIRYEAP